MKKTLSFLRGQIHLITWTGFYVFVLWAILKFLFNFSIFNGAQWHRLMHAELHGFAGFVFGIMILAAVPLYIATSALIIKKGAPLFEIPMPKMPKWIKNINFSKIFHNSHSPVENTVVDPAPAPAQDKKTESRPDIPLEMRTAFLRAKNHPIKIEKQKTTEQKNTAPAPDSEILPLPDDFDIQMDAAFDDAPIEIPTFTDINFDDDADNDDDTKFKHDIEITDTHAIVTHNDPDFFVADDDNWFATGKVLPSPIAAVMKAATEHNVTPVIHLAQKNILDIETLIEKWESNGITVISDLSEL